MPRTSALHGSLARWLADCQDPSEIRSPAGSFFLELLLHVNCSFRLSHITEVIVSNRRTIDGHGERHFKAYAF